MLKSLLFLLPLLPLSVFAAGLQGSLQTQWQSHYISEGRDNLPGSSLYSVSADLAVKDLSGGVWQAWEQGGSYRENNLYLEYAPVAGNWNPYLNLTYLQFHPDDPDDLEAGFGVSRSLSRIVSVALDGSWSKQAEGSFYALSVIAEEEVSASISVNVHLTQTYDHGYASDAYNGLNNTEAGAQVTWTTPKGINLYAGWQYSWAGEDVRRDGGDNESWGQLGLMTYF